MPYTMPYNFPTSLKIFINYSTHGITLIDTFDFFHILLKWGETPLQVAEKYKRGEVVSYLLNGTNEEGTSSDASPS